MEKTLADCVEESLEYIDAHGWCKGDLKDDLGRVCIVGAIITAQCVDHPQSVTGQAGRVLDIVHHKAREMGYSAGAAQFNDNAKTTLEDVRDFLINVAKDLRNEGR